jgi:hypothetical protein
MNEQVVLDVSACGYERSIKPQPESSDRTA